MSPKRSAAHFAGDDYEAVALPYAGRELELFAVKPAAGTFDSFTQSLTAADVTRIGAGAKTATRRCSCLVLTNRL